MKDFLSSASELAIQEYWRQQLTPKLKVSIEDIRPQAIISLIRPLTHDEKFGVAYSQFPEGDIRFTWYGAFDSGGAMLGATDDYQQLKKLLLKCPVRLQEVSGYQ